MKDLCIPEHMHLLCAYIFTQVKFAMFKCIGSKAPKAEMEILWKIIS